MKQGSGLAIRAQDRTSARLRFWGRFAVVCPDEVPPKWGDYCSCQEWKGRTHWFHPHCNLQDVPVQSSQYELPINKKTILASRRFEKNLPPASA